MTFDFFQVWYSQFTIKKRYYPFIQEKELRISIAVRIILDLYDYSLNFWEDLKLIFNFKNAINWGFLKFCFKILRELAYKYHFFQLKRVCFNSPLSMLKSCSIQILSVNMPLSCTWTLKFWIKSSHLHRSPSN